MRKRAFDRHRIARRPRALLILSVASLPVGANADSVKSAWADNVSRKQTFARVLVVGVTPDVNQRCAFERSLVAKLKSEATVAIPSCDAVSQKNPLTRESIEAAVAAKNADAVIATSLVAKEWALKDGGSYDTRGGAYYKATDSYYGVYGTVVAADFQAVDSITTVQGEAHLMSKLYETHGATVVYSVDTKVRNVTSTDVGISTITSLIAKKLRKDGLIR